MKAALIILMASVTGSALAAPFASREGESFQVSRRQEDDLCSNNGRAITIKDYIAEYNRCISSIGKEEKDCREEKSKKWQDYRSTCPNITPDNPCATFGEKVIKHDLLSKENECVYKDWREPEDCREERSQNWKKYLASCGRGGLA